MTLKLWAATGEAAAVPGPARPRGNHHVLRVPARHRERTGQAHNATAVDRRAVQLAAAPVHAGDGFEVKLNAPAQQRLAVFAGIALQRLRRCLPLPAFTDGADDHGTPRLAMVGAGSQTRSHCTRCIARLPGRPPIKVYDGHAPVICGRHRRWLGIPPTPGQFDLCNTPEIITANRRCDRLVPITGRPAMGRHPVPGRRMGHHRLVGHSSPALAPASHRPRETPPRLHRQPSRAGSLRHGWPCCPKPWFSQRFSATPHGAARSPPPATTARETSTCTSPHRLGVPAGFATRVRVSGDPAQELGRSTPGPAPRHLHRRLVRPNPARAKAR
jgi:hypothetical protein